MSAKRNSDSPPPDRVLDCAGQIVSLIRSGQIVLHRRLGESSLAETLQVSRAIVRSALEHLEMAGLVARVPRSGTFLREISVSEFCDVMDIRAALETLAARLAAVRALDRDFKSLNALAKQVDILNRRFAGGDEKAVLELAHKDLEFHLAIARLSGNGRLATTLKQQRLIEFTFAMAQHTILYRELKNRPVPTHADVVEAIRGRDPAQAEEVMRCHILRTKEARLGVFTGEIA